MLFRLLSAFAPSMIAQFLIIPSAAANYALPPMEYTLFCRSYPAECNRSTGRLPDEAAALLHLQSVNSLANGAITPIRQSSDGWRLYPSHGDCADYAVSKRHTLLSIGWPASQLRLAEVAIRKTGEHHLVLLAFVHGSIWVLDNLQKEVVKLHDVENRYRIVRFASPNPDIWMTSVLTK
ncbi:transglutaminase-like cysteine peptidase [Bradyrhizobium sp. 40]|uniref:transglutaminase-like cysteine peptidase n=1 Tax=Bradyrhizobium sp. 40 TaxID=2782674 RepID=UPI001FFF1F67|nr:transglutaminase-like cysteine peptidase [Bradyrhizobium sp. 40]UPJ41139.1 transglutaminase-like cysteine peptidase [Bradyrhizobium sp. 40]